MVVIWGLDGGYIGPYIVAGRMAGILLVFE